MFWPRTSNPLPQGCVPVALRVNSNLAANSIIRQLKTTTRTVDSGLERLASGLRVNRAADDAAGLSVREGLRAELSGLQVNTRHAELANNLLQTAEGSLNEVNAMLIRMRELAVQSSDQPPHTIFLAQG